MFALSLLLGSVSFAGGNQCASLFKDEVTVVTAIKTKKDFQNISKNSPSGLNPVFRLPHEDQLEMGPNGIYILNPANIVWKQNSGVQSYSPSTKSPEKAVTFKVDFSSTKKQSLKIENRKEFENAISFDNTDVGFPALIGVSRIKIRASSSDPSQVHQLSFNIDGKTYNASFKAPLKPTDIFIDFPFTKNEMLRSVEVELNWKKGKKNKFDLSLFGPIVFERGLESEKTAAWKYLKEFFEYFHENATYKEENVNTTEILRKVIKNMNNSKLLERSFAIAKRGRTGISKALNTAFHGEIELREFSEKIDPNEFFQTGNLEKDNPLFVPVEKGPFSKEHGAYVHALQLLAMTEGLTQKELFVFKYEIYRAMFSGDPQAWSMWEILFDAPGNSTSHSPRWWRQELEKREIPFTLN